MRDDFDDFPSYRVVKARPNASHHLSGQIVLRSLNSFVEVYNKTNWL